MKRKNNIEKTSFASGIEEKEVINNQEFINNANDVLVVADEQESLVPTPEPVADETTIIEAPNETGEKKRKKDKRNKLKYRTKANDIKYQGPLSYRHLRMLGWLFMAVSQLGIIFSVAQKIDPGTGFDYGLATSIISFFATLPFALFMLANFGIILRNRKNFRYLFVFYGGIMIAMYALANIVVLHYVYGTFRMIAPEISFQDVSLLVGTFMVGLGNTGYMFNLFIDLFLCVLTVFFLFYNPKNKHLQGKKVFFFRMLVVIPIAYEIASIIIKQNALLGNMLIPSYVFFLLTSKPPLTFAAFFIVTLIIKIREYKCLKLYNYDQHAVEENNMTNAHSFSTSITIAIVFTIVSHLDIILFVVYFAVQLFKIVGYNDYDENIFEVVFQATSKVGFGGSIPLMLIAPLVLLYSYTRTHKNKKIDSFLPLMGIGLMIFTLVEGMYLTLRISLPELLGGLFDGGEEELPSDLVPGEGEGELDPDLFLGEEGESFQKRGIPLELVAMKTEIFRLFHPVR